MDLGYGVKDLFPGSIPSAKSMPELIGEFKRLRHKVPCIPLGRKREENELVFSR